MCMVCVRRGGGRGTRGCKGRGNLLVLKARLQATAGFYADCPETLI